VALPAHLRDGIRSAGIALFLLANYVFLKEFDPVQLKAREERVLDEKLRAVAVYPPECYLECHCAFE